MRINYSDKGGVNVVKKPKLTDKQKVFCSEYLIDYNGTRAALVAGYSKKSATQAATENLGKPYIREYLDKMIQETCYKLEIKRERIISDIASIAFDDMGNYLEFENGERVAAYKDNGEPIIEDAVIVRVKDSKTIDTKNISEISIGRDGQFKFKTYARDNALYKLADMLRIGEKDGDNKLLVQIVDDIK